tara:strand:- start:66586 stop:66957 length:372 start_codon:yes stop_codon:yes gene_type:complete
MSILNDYEITVHAKGVANGSEYAPCSINVQHIFMSTALRSPNKAPEITDRRNAYTRLDLTHPFNCSGRITTADRVAQNCYETKEHTVQSSLMTQETTEEIAALKTEAQKKHLEFLKSNRAFII